MEIHLPIKKRISRLMLLETQPMFICWWITRYSANELRIDRIKLRESDKMIFYGKLFFASTPFYGYKIFMGLFRFSLPPLRITICVDLWRVCRRDCVHFLAFETSIIDSIQLDYLDSWLSFPNMCWKLMHAIVQLIIGKFLIDNFCYH